MSVEKHERPTECERMVARLVELSADRLDPSADEEVSAHLAACESCRSDLAAIRRTMEILSQPDVLRVPEELAAITARRAREQVRFDRSGSKAGAVKLFSILVKPIVNPMARAAAAAAILLFVLPLSSVDIAERIGAWQRRVIGEEIARKIDPVGEKILDFYGGIVSTNDEEKQYEPEPASRRGKALAPTTVEA